MFEDSPHGEQRLAEAVLLLRRECKIPVPDYIVRAMSSRDHYATGVDLAIESFGLGMADAANVLVLLEEHHRVEPHALTGIKDLRIERKEVCSRRAMIMASIGGEA